MHANHRFDVTIFGNLFRLCGVFVNGSLAGRYVIPCDPVILCGEPIFRVQIRGPDPVIEKYFQFIRVFGTIYTFSA